MATVIRRNALVLYKKMGNAAVYSFLDLLFNHRPCKTGQLCASHHPSLQLTLLGDQGTNTRGGGVPIL